VSFDDIKTGSVIDYPYLWSHEEAAGKTEGRKLRPTAVGLRVPVSGKPDLLFLFPITSRPQPSKRFCVEIPEIEKRRAGLDVDVRLWLVLDDYNLDAVGASYYLEPNSKKGTLSKKFLEPLLDEFVRRRSVLKVVDRRG